jgi:hypothetical protein
MEIDFLVLCERSVERYLSTKFKRMKSMKEREEVEDQDNDDEEKGKEEWNK